MNDLYTSALVKFCRERKVNHAGAEELVEYAQTHGFINCEEARLVLVTLYPEACQDRTLGWLDWGTAPN